MNDFNKRLEEDIKAKVKVNIYKTLLEEEKQKNKRNTTIGLSLFIVGIISTSAIYQVKTESGIKNIPFEQGIVQNVEVQSNLPKYLEGNKRTEMEFFNEDVVETKILSNIKEEDFFVSDFKM